MSMSIKRNLRMMMMRLSIGIDMVSSVKMKKKVSLIVHSNKKKKIQHFQFISLKIKFSMCFLNSSEPSPYHFNEEKVIKKEMNLESN